MRLLAAAPVVGFGVSMITFALAAAPDILGVSGLSNTCPGVWDKLVWILDTLRRALLKALFDAFCASCKSFAVIFRACLSAGAVRDADLLALMVCMYAE